MATTTVYSLAGVVLLLLVLGAASLVVAGDGPIAQECMKTAYPETCVSAISNASHYGDTTKPLGLATVAVMAAGDMLAEARSTATTEGYNHEDMPSETDRCLGSCGKDKLDKGAQECHIRDDEDGESGDAAMIARVRKFLAEAKEKGVRWNCGECLSTKQYPYPKKTSILNIDKGGELDKFMAVLPVILERATTTK